jgi:phospholipase/carboxylesterase
MLDKLQELEDLSLEGIIAPPRPDTPLHPCTLVLLHGYGANASDLLGLRDELDPGMACVSLQAPHDLGPLGMPGGRAWFHLQVTPEGDIDYDTAGAMAAVKQLAQVVPAAIEQAGGTRMLLLGFSQGAMLSHALLLKEHLSMDGLAGCSGRLVPEVFDKKPLDVPAGLPVFLSHGTLDEIIPFQSGQAIRDAYAQHSKADVTWVEEPIGHGIGPSCLASLQTWCLNRR